MKITQLRALAEPNYWSAAHTKLIICKLDPENVSLYTKENVRLLKQNFKRRLPVIHAISYFCDDDNLQNSECCGTKAVVNYMEAIATGLLMLAGMDGGYSTNRALPEKNRYELVFSYTNENAGRYAAHAAVDITEALLWGENFDLDQHVKQLRLLANGGTENADLDTAGVRKTGVHSLNFSDALV
jgi:cyanophycin synthetase